MALVREAALRYRSGSQEDTERFGEIVAPLLADGDVLVLTGGLGVGKTHFTKGVSRALGDEHPVTPTSWRTPAFSMCWATKVRACWSGANSFRMS